MSRVANESAVYLSTLRALLEAASGAMEERAQGIAEAVVQELAVETCAIALRRHGEATARLVGHARRWDAGTRVLDEERALALSRLVSGDEVKSHGRSLDAACLRLRPFAHVLAAACDVPNSLLRAPLASDDYVAHYDRLARRAERTA